MEVFNIIVGIFSIIGSIAAVVSLVFLKQISLSQGNNGINNRNNSQYSIGDNNSSTIIQK